MRVLTLLVGGAMLASCATEPPPPTPDARARAQYEQLVGGKVAQSPMSCVPNYRHERHGRYRWAHCCLSPGIENDLHRAFESRDASLSQAARTRCYRGSSAVEARAEGDIQQVLDTSSRMRAGSCTIAEIVPYSTPGR